MKAKTPLVLLEHAKMMAVETLKSPQPFLPRHPEPCEGSKGTDTRTPPAWILRTAQDDGSESLMFPEFELAAALSKWALA